MSEFLLEWMPENKLLIVIISILLNVMVSISGILPSAFLTAVNISIFDFKIGLTLSIIGEAIGAIVSFILYRKGLGKLSKHVHMNNKWLLRLQHTHGLEAVILILILRILPFVPSGIVTLIASYSKMSIYVFGLASTIGKVPSLVIEAYIVDRALDLNKEWQLVTFLVLIFIFIVYVFRNKRKKQ